ncbi:hypothetical protein AN958_09229 [Leucoagaricus sp. SymC.cos]|nr:hypothetical protein AN958_09229 [Leucoagaricus sp. SymC.cos]
MKLLLLFHLANMDNLGPYDELIYVPGRWKYPNNDLAFRVTRIYVSTKESTENGRRNWNIPKQVANFDYKPGPNGTTLFGVTLPGSSTPFFKASIKPIPLLSSVSVSFSTTMLGRWYSLMQPPLPSGEKPEEVATDKWAAVTPVLKGKTKVMRFVPGFEDGSVGDGVAFPRVRPWKVASVIQDGELDFAVPTWYDKV